MLDGHDTTLKDCSGIRLSGSWVLVSTLVLDLGILEFGGRLDEFAQGWVTSARQTLFQ